MDEFIGITNQTFFNTLTSHFPDLDKVKFWQPSGKTTFKTQCHGALFLSKHRLYDFLAGDEFFTLSTHNAQTHPWKIFLKKDY
jgi:hypothetical protein